MATIAVRATFWSHIKTIINTPVAFVFGAALANRTELIILVVVVIICLLTGVIDFALPNWNAIRSGLPFASYFIISLMSIATLLSANDHLKFGGWTDCEIPEVEFVVKNFTTAVLADSPDDAAACCTTDRMADSAEFAVWLHSLRSQFSKDSVSVSASDLETVDHVIFRLVVPILKRINDDRIKAVAFVPILRHVQIRVGKPMKVLQAMCCADESGYLITDAAVIEIPRPEVLR